MLTFLRKIRKSLIESGTTQKYLLYAIGEIALVVIGILIALQINNWNESKNDYNLSQEYLHRIRADIAKDTGDFKAIINYGIDLRERIKESLVIMYSGFESREQVVEVMAVYDEGLNQVFVSNNNTYTDMISTGNLRLIKNIELRDLIVNLYNQYEEKRKLMESDKNWMDGIAVNLDSNVNFLKFSKDINDIFTQPEMLSDSEWLYFKNPKSKEFNFVVRAISSTAWNLSVRNGYLEELISECNKVLSAIDVELSESQEGSINR